MRWSQHLGIVAETLQQARQARDLLDITWSPGSWPDLNDESLTALFQQQLTQPGVLVEEHGNAEAALASGALVHSADYLLPFLAHATLEPMNCLADVRPDFCEVWAPLQNQTAALETVQEFTGLPADRIIIHTTFLGGGFGRRLEVDYVAEAVRLSQAAGQPVKLVWTREEDFRSDFFRPMTASRLRASLAASGRLTAWDHTIAAPSILARLYPAGLKKGYDPNTVDGILPFPYACPHFRLTAVRTDTPIPVGFWRSVGHSHNAFTVECFLDELAHMARQDPLAFRLAHLPPASRAARLLTLAAEKAGWGTPLPPGWGRGLAQHFSFGSYVAQVAEVTVDQDTGRIQVQRVVCALDCGQVVNPDTVVAQMEGGILFGLSAALHEEVHFVNGGVATKNFHDYRLLTLPETPAIEVYPAPNGAPPGGVGEPGVPPIAPAVANAVFAASGQRLRRLPLAAT
ncbi:MAG: xanthine dehydrogenase family protein molybdopterin-binding subunit [Desulfobacca sp.]|uniref:xanthine dehydrogenase family protein molybdopterin-binding subunit n=1 Tax=Desulfobacca sp. TaxID=2067990 RepID=UPI004049FBCA